VRRTVAACIALIVWLALASYTGDFCLSRTGARWAADMVWAVAPAWVGRLLRRVAVNGRGLLRRIYELLAMGWYHRRALYAVPLNLLSRVMPVGTVSIQRLRGVKIGRGCIIPKEVFIDDMDPQFIEIGDDVVMAPGVRIFAHVHYGRRLYEYMGGREVAPVRISSGAYLGANVVVLKGVTIGECAVVGAGAVVTQDIPPYTLAVGVPARPVRRLERRYEAGDGTLYDVFFREPEPLARDGEGKLGGAGVTHLEVPCSLA
jgi:acetyltransferase-like isoleucine patch superfamily enzyme